MSEDTVKAALVKAKGEAEEWFKKMAAAVAAAKEIMTQRIEWAAAKKPGTWTKIRTESQTLLYLRDDHFSIGEKLKDLQDKVTVYHNKRDNVKTSIALLSDTLNFAKEGKARCAKTFEIKLRKRQTEIDSIENELTILTNPCFQDSPVKKSSPQVAKKASLEEKIRHYPTREANKRASFDSKIKACDEQLSKKMSKLSKVEQKVAVVEETLKMMEDALRCCEEAITIFELVFVTRVRRLDANAVYEIAETADVGIIKRIYVLRDSFRRGQLIFAVPKLEICGEISKIYPGLTNVKIGKLYKLSIDGQGLFHISAAN